MPDQDCISVANDYAFGNYLFFEPYNQMQKLVQTVDPVDIEKAEDVYYAITNLEKLEDLFWSFFLHDRTALSREEFQILSTYITVIWRF